MIKLVADRIGLNVVQYHESTPILTANKFDEECEMNVSLLLAVADDINKTENKDEYDTGAVTILHLLVDYVTEMRKQPKDALATLRYQAEKARQVTVNQTSQKATYYLNTETFYVRDPDIQTLNLEIDAFDQVLPRKPTPKSGCSTCDEYIHGAGNARPPVVTDFVR